MSTAEVRVRTYGNFSDTRRRGVAGLSRGATIGLLLGVLVLVAVLLVLGLPAALVWVGVMALAAVPTRVSRRDGRSGYQRAVARMGFRRAQRAGQTVYLAGPGGHTPDGKCRLPGLLASSELTVERDPLGAEFAMLTLPKSRHHTVVIDAPATGLHLVDQPVIDQHVAGFGHWLATLAEYPELVGASIVVESAPDPGVRLRRMVNGNIEDDAPVFARNVMKDLAEEYAAAAPQITTRVTLTFSGAAAPGRDARDRGEMAAHIGLILPALVGTLRLSGCPGAQPLSAQDLVDSVRVSYDPSVAQEVELARAGDGTGLTWDAVGPTLHREGDDTYQHDRAWSRVWQMQEPPKGIIQADQMTRLLEPHKAIDRKRVTLLYRPVDPVLAAEQVEEALNDARFGQKVQRRPTARGAAAIRAAERTAEEEARGAALIRFGMIVTATVTDQSRLAAVNNTIERLGTAAKLRLRPALGSQATSFAAGLPLGLVLPEHMAINTKWQDQL